MMNLPTEVWWEQILPKTDDETLFNIMKSGIVHFDHTLFWKKRIEEHWIVNTVEQIEPSLDGYMDIISRWNEFMHPFKENTKFELLYVEKGSPCKTPYHLSITQEIPNVSSRKSIICAPAYIKQEWARKHEFWEFHTMNELLNWRMRTIEYPLPLIRPRRRLRGCLGEEDD